jgi:hypothetical protein
VIELGLKGNLDCTITLDACLRRHDGQSRVRNLNRCRSRFRHRCRCRNFSIPISIATPIIVQYASHKAAKARGGQKKADAEVGPYGFVGNISP